MLAATLLDVARLLLAAALALILILTVVAPAQAGWTSDAWGYIERGDDLATRRLWRRATVAYTKAIAIDPGAADAYAGRCHTLRMARQFDRALADCTR